MADHLTISTADENNFDWETMLPSNSTATTVSESPVISLNERITKLELLVNTLLMENNSPVNLLSYDWSETTRYYLNKKKFNGYYLVKYFKDRANLPTK
tara:strand:- start:87 stop:383 length:297 start_codon:yes stop_codon:yes gene_type:complete